MKTVHLTCIGCPLGCSLTAQLDGKEVISVTGNTCQNGDRYARKELTNPTRIVTSTVCVLGGTQNVVPVKTACDIPKGKIFDVVRSIKSLKVPAPVKIGQVLLADAAGTGAAIIATKSVDCR